jgi:hypothetical protein
MSTVNINNKNQPYSTMVDDQIQIYYNARISSDTGDGPNLAVYNQNRVVPILQKASDYELAIVRFSVPTTQIPMFYWKTNFWSLTLRYNNVDYLQYLQFIPNTTTNVEAVFEQQSFIDSINNAFKASFLALITANPGIASDFEPIMYYDVVNDLITMNVQQNYLVDNIEIYFNNPLNTLLYSFQNFFNQEPPSQQVYKIIVVDRGGLNGSTLNGQPSYLMVQEFPTTFTWATASKIRFETSSIPVVRELDGAQTNITSALLTDFDLPGDQRYSREPLIFYPVGPLRWINLSSDDALYRIDIQVFYQDKEGGKFPLYLINGEDLTIKMLFRKRVGLRLKNVIDDSVDDALNELNI